MSADSSVISSLLVHNDCVKSICALVSPSVMIFFFFFTHLDYFLSLESELQVLCYTSLLGEKKRKKIDSTRYYVPLLDYEAVALGEKKQPLIPRIITSYLQKE